MPLITSPLPSTHWFVNLVQSHLKALLVRLFCISLLTIAIYCYACNEDRNDDNLAVHLQTLGIDVLTQKKTEKTIQEMDLELNLNFTLSKIIEDGK